MYKNKILSMFLAVVMVFSRMPIGVYATPGTLSDVYLDSLNGKDSNTGDSGTLAVQTFEKAFDLVISGGTIHFLGQSIEISKNTVYGQRGKPIKITKGINQDVGLSFEYFEILNNSTLVLQYMTLDYVDESNHVGSISPSSQVNITKGSTLKIGEDLFTKGEGYITPTGGIIRINSTINLDETIKYKVNADKMDEDQVFLKCNMDVKVTDSIKNAFSLTSKEGNRYEILFAEGNLSLIAHQCANYKDSVYISGNGDDKYDGSNESRAVKTIDRAKELAEQNNLSKLCVTETIVINEDIEFPSIFKEIYNKSNTMFKINSGEVTIPENTLIFLNSETGIEVNGGELDISNVQVETNFRTAIKVLSGKLYTTAGSTIKTTYGTALEYNVNGSEYVHAGNITVGNGGSAIKNFSGKFKIDSSISNINGPIRSYGTSLKLENLDGNKKYNVAFQNVRIGDTAIEWTGGEYSKGSFTLVDTDYANELVKLGDQNKIVLNDTSSVYIDPKASNDTEDGSFALPFKSLTQDIINNAQIKGIKKITIFGGSLELVFISK